MTNTADTAGAITALSSVLDSLEKRQSELATQLSAAKEQRRLRLDEHVTTLLPDISGTTMERLKQEVPLFAADYKVMTAFEQNRKIYWLFKPPGYDNALALLQAQLKRYSERRGIVSSENQTIQQLESEKKTLAAQQSEALKMLRLIERAHHSDIQLPPEAVTSINNLAQRGRTLNSRTQRISSSMHEHNFNVDDPVESLLDACNGIFGKAGFSSKDMPQDSPEAKRDLSSIATDDRLGVFS